MPNENNSENQLPSSTESAADEITQSASETSRPLEQDGSVSYVAH